MTSRQIEVRAHFRPPRKPKASKKLGFYTKLAPDLHAALKQYKRLTGTPEAVQVDSALRTWFADRRVAWPLPEKEKRTSRNARRKEAGRER